MSKFMMQRDRTVASLSGHIIAFKKGEPIHVPPAAYSEVMAAGAVPVDDDFVQPADPDATTTDSGESLDPVARKDKIIAAFETLKARNERGDFGADGKPHPKAITKLVGFLVEARERNQLWAEYLDTDQ